MVIIVIDTLDDEALTDWVCISGITEAVELGKGTCVAVVALESGSKRNEHGFVLSELAWQAGLDVPFPSVN